MFQKVTIIGNLGGDPETRYTQSGSSVCSFSVATNRRWTNSDGTPGEETVWWRVSAWGRLGEVCQQYLSKGRQVFIEGEIQPDRETGSPRIWTDQNGQPRASFELRASTVKFLSGDGGSSGGGTYEEDRVSQSRQQAAPARQERSAPAQRPARSSGRRSTMSAPEPVDDFDDDRFSPDEIPF